MMTCTGGMSLACSTCVSCLSPPTTITPPTTAARIAPRNVAGQTHPAHHVRQAGRRRVVWVFEPSASWPTTRCCVGSKPWDPRSAGSLDIGVPFDALESSSVWRVLHTYGTITLVFTSSTTVFDTTHEGDRSSSPRVSTDIPDWHAVIRKGPPAVFASGPLSASASVVPAILPGVGGRVCRCSLPNLVSRLLLPLTLGFDAPVDGIWV